MAVFLKDTASIYRADAKPLSALDRFVTAAPPMLVRVTNGSFSRSVVLRFPNLTATALMNILYIELLPLRDKCVRPTPDGKPHEYDCIRLRPDGQVDASRSEQQLRPGFTPYQVQLPFVPFLQAGGGSPDPDAAGPGPGDNLAAAFADQTLARFVVRARAAQERRRLMSRRPRLGPDSYAAEHGLHAIALSDRGLSEASKRWLKDPAAAADSIRRILDRRAVGPLRLEDDDRRLMSALCEVLVARNRKYQASLRTPSSPFAMPPPITTQFLYCRHHPERILRLSRVIHVGRIDGAKPLQRIFNPQLSYALLSNFMVARSHSNDSANILAGKPFAPLFKAIESLGIPVPLDFTHTVSASNSRSKSESAIASLSDTMDFDPLALNIPTVGSRACLQVSVVPRKFSPFYDSTPGARNGLYLCAEEHDRLDVAEIFAHVFTRSRDSSIVSAYDPGSQSVNLSLRGDRDVSAFFYSVRTALRTDNGEKVFPSTFAEAADTYFTQTPMVYPDLVINPVHFATDSVPSFIEMALGQYSESFNENPP
jgi:hypothetical protein